MKKILRTVWELIAIAAVTVWDYKVIILASVAASVLTHVLISSWLPR